MRWKRLHLAFKMSLKETHRVCSELFEGLAAACGSDPLGRAACPCASWLPSCCLPHLLLVSRPTDKSDGFMWKFCGDKYLPVSNARSEHDFSCAVWK